MQKCEVTPVRECNALHYADTILQSALWLECESIAAADCRQFEWIIRLELIA